MKELIRKHVSYSSGGKTKRIRVIKESADILEGLYRFLKTPLVLNTDKEWDFSVEEKTSEDGMRHYHAKATSNDETDPVFFYDFVADENDDDIVNRFIEGAEAITGQYVRKED